MVRWFLYCGISLLLVFVGGCAQVSDTGARQITVLAPRVLADIVKVAADQFRTENKVRVAVTAVADDALYDELHRGGGFDLFVACGPGPMRTIARKDTLFYENSYECRFALGLVLAGRRDGPALSEIADLKDEAVHRVVIIDPGASYEGYLGREILKKYHLFKDIRPRLIEARTRAQAVSYLETGEADAAVLFEYTLASISNGRRIAYLNDKINDKLTVCGAVISSSRNRETARAFLDLLSSSQCAIYNLAGVYKAGHLPK
jgi:molybdate transport system substrate-binding protein